MTLHVAKEDSVRLFSQKPQINIAAEETGERGKENGEAPGETSSVLQLLGRVRDWE